MLSESLILCKHESVLLSLTLKKNTISNIFLLYIHCRNAYTKGKALMKMYRVVPQTKRRNNINVTLSILLDEHLLYFG